MFKHVEGKRKRPPKEHSNHSYSAPHLHSSLQAHSPTPTLGGSNRPVTSQ